MRFFTGIAFTAGCLAVLLFGLLYPLEIFEKEHRQTKRDISFGRRIEFKLEQPFYSGRNGLAGLELAVQNPNGRSMILRIKDSSGNTISQEHWGRSVTGFYIIRFKPVYDSAGKNYSFELDIAKPGSLINLMGGGGEINENSLIIGGKHVAAFLYYQLVYKVGLAEKVSILAERTGKAKPFIFSTGFLIVLHIALFAAIAGWAAVIMNAGETKEQMVGVRSKEEIQGIIDVHK